MATAGRRAGAGNRAPLTRAAGRARPAEIRQALADAYGNQLEAAALLLRHCENAESIRALARGFAPRFREASPVLSRLIDESQRAHGDTPAVSKALDEQLDPRENPRLADTVGDEVARWFLALLLVAIREEARGMGA